MTPVDYEVSLSDTRKAWKAICRAIRRHENAHGELPSKLFVSMAGIAAIQYGVLDGMEDEIQIVAVAHWPCRHHPYCCMNKKQKSEQIDSDSKIIGSGFYRESAPGSFGRSEWLDLLMACQDGRATCMRVLEIIERELSLQRSAVTDEMVNRFLCWRLPATFNPDCGVAFDKNDRDPNSHWWPTGTNLLDAEQARKMIEHIISDHAQAA